MLKIAGDVNTQALQALSQRLRPGDIVNFETRFGDVAKERGIRAALKDLMISKPIAAVTGSPQTHTAMLEKIHPDGSLGLIHNYEQGMRAVVHRVTPQQFQDFAKTTNLHFYRPQGATVEQGLSAAERAAQAVGSAAKYSYTDLGLSGGRQIAEKAKAVLPVAKNAVTAADLVSNVKRGITGCDPASGFCSHLAAEAWSNPLGGLRKAQQLLGTNVTNIPSSLPVTPGSIQRAAASGALQRLGTYVPANATSSTLSGVASRIRDIAGSTAPTAQKITNGIIGKSLRRAVGSIIGKAAR